MYILNCTHCCIYTHNCIYIQLYTHTIAYNYTHNSTHTTVHIHNCVHITNYTHSCTQTHYIWDPSLTMTVNPMTAPTGLWKLRREMKRQYCPLTWHYLKYYVNVSNSMGSPLCTQFNIRLPAHCGRALWDRHKNFLPPRQSPLRNNSDL